MKILYCILMMVIISPAVRAGEKESWLGPTIESLVTKEGATAMEMLSTIKAEIEKSETKAFALRVDVAEEDLAKIKVSFTFTKIPALHALHYLAKSSGLELIFEEGIWILRTFDQNRKKDPDQTLTLFRKEISRQELRALGFKFTTYDSLVDVNGFFWPRNGSVRAATYQNNIFTLKAPRGLISDIEALLALHRRGYTIPYITDKKPPRSWEDLQARGATGKLGEKLGTVMNLQVKVVNAQALGLTVEQDRYLLSIINIDGLLIKEPILMEFAYTGISNNQMPTNLAELIEHYTIDPESPTKKEGSKMVEEQHLRKIHNIQAYETGSFEASPLFPEKFTASSKIKLRFKTSLVVLEW